MELPDEDAEAFIENKPCPEGENYCLILDNAPWPKKLFRKIWTEGREKFANIHEKLDYILLPPYSPELNPIEQIWEKTRREKTHNKYFCSLSKLIGVIDSYFAGFFVPNDQLRSLCSFSCSA